MKTHTRPYMLFYLFSYFEKATLTAQIVKRRPSQTSTKNSTFKEKRTGTKQHKTKTWASDKNKKGTLLLRSTHVDFLIAISKMWERLVARELMANDFSLKRNKDFRLQRISKLLSLQHQTVLENEGDRHTQTPWKTKVPPYTFFDSLFFVCGIYTRSSDRQKPTITDIKKQRVH